MQASLQPLGLFGVYWMECDCYVRDVMLCGAMDAEAGACSLKAARSSQSPAAAAAPPPRLSRRPALVPAS